MSQKNKLEYDKQITENLQQKNKSIILTLMKKYNMTQKESEEVLMKIKKNNKKEKLNKKRLNQLNENKQNNTELEISKKKDCLDNKITLQHEINEQKKELSSENIDSIMHDVLPTYEKHVAIELNNVNLTFKVTLDKIDTLKELFIKKLTRKKNKEIKLHALNNITFKIYNGEKVGVIGYNGAGKSTLLNVITGIYPPDTGEIKTFGKISPLLSLGAGFDYNYSGRKNIYLNGAILGYEKKFLQEKEKEIIEFSELEEFIDLPIKNYSSGMLAKLGFSIATIVNPDILIIDEVLGVGDVNFQKKCADKIRSLMDSGTTVILVSHSIPQVRELCDKAIWIKEGEVKEIGDVNTVCDNYLKDAEKASREQLANIKFK